MCYAIPGRIIAIKGKTAVLDYFGDRRTATIICGWHPAPRNRKLKIGDYVYAQGGIIIDVIPEAEALRTLEVWKGQFFELKKTDERLTAGRSSGGLQMLLEKAEAGRTLSRKEMLKILDADEPATLESLYRTANRIRAKKLKNSCCVHGIIEFSNHCVNECAYCGINRNNKKIRRYRMDADEIVERAGFAVEKLGFRALVLQSGEDAFYTDDMLVEIVSKIRERFGVLLFISIGERDFNCYKKLYDAGAYGALLRFETSNANVYADLRPGRRLEQRLGLIHKLISHGFIVATGAIIGLPGTTKQDLINDILLTKSLRPDMWSFGPLIPHPCTPFAGTPRVPIDISLKTIALSRLIDPEAKILVTTALETLAPDGGRLGLLAGANSLMINVTPEEYAQDYEIYPGKGGRGVEVTERIRETLHLLHSLGRAPTDLGLR